MNMDKKKINNSIILILVIAVAIVGGIFLMVLGGRKDDSLSLGIELEKIESETLSTEDEGTQLEGSESSETEPPTTSEIETEEQQADAPEAETKPGTGSTKNNTTTKPGNTENNSGSGNISEIAPNIPQYDPADTNKDGWVDANEEMRYITPQKQKCIDAGYGVVVEQDDGKWYSILCKNGDQLINGKMGNEVLREYLKERNLHPDQIIGSWINSDNEWYWYVAEGITEIPESEIGDDFNFEDGEIEWH